MNITQTKIFSLALSVQAAWGKWNKQEEATFVRMGLCAYRDSIHGWNRPNPALCLTTDWEHTINRDWILTRKMRDISFGLECLGRIMRRNLRCLSPVKIQMEDFLSFFLSLPQGRETGSGTHCLFLWRLDSLRHELDKLYPVLSSHIWCRFYSWIDSWIGCRITFVL